MPTNTQSPANCTGIKTQDTTAQASPLPRSGQRAFLHTLGAVTAIGTAQLGPFADSAISQETDGNPRERSPDSYHIRVKAAERRENCLSSSKLRMGMKPETIRRFTNRCGLLKANLDFYPGKVACKRDAVHFCDDAC